MMPLAARCQWQHGRTSRPWHPRTSALHLRDSYEPQYIEVRTTTCRHLVALSSERRYLTLVSLIGALVSSVGLPIRSSVAGARAPTPHKEREAARFVSLSDMSVAFMLHCGSDAASYAIASYQH